MKIVSWKMYQIIDIDRREFVILVPNLRFKFVENYQESEVTNNKNKQTNKQTNKNKKIRLANKYTKRKQKQYNKTKQNNLLWF